MSPAPAIPPRATGLGWRPETALLVHRHEGIGLTEVVAENLDPRRLPRPLLDLRDRGVPIIVHGVGLGLGDAGRPDPARLDHLAALALALGSPLVSEHIAFVRGGDREAGHLLPVERTPETLDVLVENIELARRHLPVPLAVENIAALVAWPGDTLTEAEFLRRLCARSEVSLLFDAANWWANAFNFGWSAIDELAALPLDRIAYAHVAGGRLREGYYVDTHAHAMGEGPRAVAGALLGLRPALPVLLERDDHFDGEASLRRELAAIDAMRPPVPAREELADARP